MPLCCSEYPNGVAASMTTTDMVKYIPALTAVKMPIVQNWKFFDKVFTPSHIVILFATELMEGEFIGLLGENTMGIAHAVDIIATTISCIIF